MARFDVYFGKRGYLLDVQADVLESFATRIIVPLMPKDRVPQSVRQLNPVFVVDGKPLTMATHLLIAIPKAEIGAFRISLAPEADTITRAIDIALQGF